jgi:hypothetical protein
MAHGLRRNAGGATSAANGACSVRQSNGGTPLGSAGSGRNIGAPLPNSPDCEIGYAAAAASRPRRCRGARKHARRRAERRQQHQLLVGLNRRRLAIADHKRAAERARLNLDLVAQLAPPVVALLARRVRRVDLHRARRQRAHQRDADGVGKRVERQQRHVALARRRRPAARWRRRLAAGAPDARRSVVGDAVAATHRRSAGGAADERAARRRVDARRQAAATRRQIAARHRARLRNNVDWRRDERAASLAAIAPRLVSTLVSDECTGSDCRRCRFEPSLGVACPARTVVAGRVDRRQSPPAPSARATTTSRW